LEQIYPFPYKNIKNIISKYNNAQKFVWVQEEPENFGIMPFLLRKFRTIPLDFIAREESATPATGFFKQYVTEQKEIINKAFQ